MDIQDLIRENKELRLRLAHAERWMRREVQTALVELQKSRVTKGIRTHFSNVFETSGINLITQSLLSRFPDGLHHAPKYTLERLIDAEIYWYTLQKYPNMDALPIVLSYQKILDSWVEQFLVKSWRTPAVADMDTVRWSDTPLDAHIMRMASNKYTLSLGRLYQIIDLIREKKNISGWTEHIIEYWKEHSSFFDLITSDTFFLPLQELVQLEVFSIKRHTKKVSFADARHTRDLCIGENGIFLHIFS